MASAPDQVLDAAKALLVSMTTVPDANVGRDRVYDSAVDTAINIRQGEDTVRLDEGTVAYLERHELHFFLDCEAKIATAAATTVVPQLNNMADEARKKLMVAYPRLSGLVEMLWLVRALAPVLSKEQEKPLGVLTLEFACVYDADERTPDVIVSAG